MAEAGFLGATRDAYDRLAVPYTELFGDPDSLEPLDRTMLTTFAELVRGTGPVLDLGCGPGHATALLHRIGVDVSGLDLAPAFMDLARKAFPHLRFEVGSMLALDIPDGSLSGILARYSIIHTPPEHLPALFAEFRRVLAPGGRLLLSFQADEDPDRLAIPFDHKVTLAYCYSHVRVTELLAAADLSLTARMVIEPGPDDERGFQQAHLLAQAGSLKERFHCRDSDTRVFSGLLSPMGRI